MTFRITDFVNREEALTNLWQMIRQEVQERILLVSGPRLIGKTYLLAELRQECQAERVGSAWVDLNEPAGQSYLTLAEKIGHQLGWDRFDQHIGQVFDASDGHPPAASGLAVRTLDTIPLPDAAPALAGHRVGGVDIYAAAEIDTVVGGNYYRVVQVVLTDDHPLVQARARITLTEAFRRFIGEVTATRAIVFLFDAWHAANTDTCDWLCDGLLSWIAGNELPGAVAIIANPEVPTRYELLRYRTPLALPHFTEASARAYWVKKKGLPPEELPNMLYAQVPGLLAMMAEQYKTAKVL